jgi:phage head maturation protease
VEEDEWTYDENNEVFLCVIKRLGKIYDTSLVTRPAYLDTDVKMRGVDLEEIAKKINPEVEPKQEPVLERSNKLKFLEIQNKIKRR